MRIILLVCLIGYVNIASAGNICHKCKSTCHKQSCVVQNVQTNVKLLSENKIINNITLLQNMQPLNIIEPVPQPLIELPTVRQFNFVSNIQPLPAKADNYISPFVQAVKTERAYAKAYISQQITIQNKALLQSDACKIINSKSYHH